MESTLSPNRLVFVVIIFLRGLVGSDKFCVRKLWICVLTTFWRASTRDDKAEESRASAR